MKIQIYGTGCNKCTELDKNTRVAVDKLGIAADIEKVTDIKAITNAGVMITPALEVNGKVVSSGKVLSSEAIIKLLQNDQSKIVEKAPCCSTETSMDSSALKDGCCLRSTEKSKSKKILTGLLLLFVFASILAMLIRETRSTQNTSSDMEQSKQTQVQLSDNIVTVYYFHGNQRCFTCNEIEKLTRQAVENEFSQQVASGKILMQSINVDLKENEHFIKDFELTIRSVVMQKGEHYEKFDEVWSLIREPEKFIAYIQNGLTRILNTDE